MSSELFDTLVASLKPVPPNEDATTHPGWGGSNPSTDCYFNGRYEIKGTLPDPENPSSPCTTGIRVLVIDQKDFEP